MDLVPIVFCLLFSLLFSSVMSAPIAYVSTKDGFELDDMESQRTFTFGIVPKVRDEPTTVSFYDVDFPNTNCDEVQVEILVDGYVKRDFYKIAAICDAASLAKFKATSDQGFHVVVRMGDNVNGGTIKAKFVAASGTSITSQRLYG